MKAEYFEHCEVPERELKEKLRRASLKSAHISCARRLAKSNFIFGSTQTHARKLNTLSLLLRDYCEPTITSTKENYPSNMGQKKQREQAL